MTPEISEFARVMIMDDWQRFLVIQEQNDLARWCFLGGKTEPGATATMVVRRSAFEELGLVLAGLRLVHQQDLDIDGAIHRGLFFHALGVRVDPSIQATRRQAEVRFVGIEGLKTMPALAGTLYEPAKVLLKNLNRLSAAGRRHGQN
ncbi:MAG: NUDIX hydrolase [Pseudomonadota bacterium]